MANTKHCQICGVTLPTESLSIVGIGQVCDDCLEDFMMNEVDAVMDRML